MSSSDGAGGESRKRLWPRMLVVTALPLLAQLAILAALSEWASGRGAGRGMAALGVTLVMLLAIPAALVANAWLARETRRWHLAWVVLVGVGQAVLIPLGIIVVVFMGLV